MEDKKAFSKFKLKEKKAVVGADGDDGAPPQSKYFKSGFIFNDDKQKQQKPKNKMGNNKMEDDAVFDDDMDEADYEKAIEMASQKLSSSKSSLASSAPKASFSSATSSFSATSTSAAESAALERVNQVASQAVDFTATKSLSHIPSLRGGNTILVNSNQQKNPLLQCLRSVRYVLSDSIAPAHYLISDSCCALFLSLKYHVINQDYIYERVNELSRGDGTYQLKILLLMVDHLSYEGHLKELTILAVRTNFTLLVAWTYDEAARHIENLRVNAEKGADVIMGRFDDGLGGGTSSSGTSSTSGKTTSSSSSSTTSQCLVEALTSVKSVNRTDAATLLTCFGSFGEIIRSRPDHFIVCPGISMVKAKRLEALFRKPFFLSYGSGDGGDKSKNASEEI